MLSKDLGRRRESYKDLDIEYSAINIRETRRGYLKGVKFGCVGENGGTANTIRLLKSHKETYYSRRSLKCICI